MTSLQLSGIWSHLTTSLVIISLGGSLDPATFFKYLILMILSLVSMATASKGYYFVRWMIKGNLLGSLVDGQVGVAFGNDFCYLDGQTLITVFSQ